MKIKLRLPPSLSPATLAPLFSALEDKVFFVGGLVRDSILRQGTPDIDLATPFTPDEVLKRLAAAHIKTIKTGCDFGTITALINHTPIEITSFRQDIKTDGRHATVTYCSDIKRDATRRDFTLNALYATKDGNILDPLGTGLSDLENGKVVFIGSPAARLAEDYLRALRYFRFYARFSRATCKDKDTRTALSAIAAATPHLATLSGERIATELKKLLSQPHPSAALSLMHTTGVLQTLCLPFSPQSIKELDEFHNRLTKLNQPLSPLLSLAFLLKGKPAPAPAHFALSNAEQHYLEQLRTARRIYHLTSKGKLLHALFLYPKDIVTDAYLMCAPAPAPSRKVLAAIATTAAPVFPLTGKDLLAAGFTEGATLGATLAHAKTKWQASNFSLSYHELLAESKKTL